MRGGESEKMINTAQLGQQQQQQRRLLVESTIQSDIMSRLKLP
jgi:hypothetical protein